ncbi:MAG: TrkH family potassium uptake protein, partial [Euryarchaeota archaeon]|nr:TrkH family potassium uptake protein [Euryarchaeota archaeon]MBV1767091.1 TrkH family potassium uptake protein [Methanobacterium sp.]
IKNDNIGSYGSDLIYYITIFLMIVGGTSFLVHYKVFKGKFSRVFKDIQFIAMLIIIILFSALIIINRYLLPIDSVFHVVSALTCTGSNIQTLSEMQGWAGYVKIIIIMAMVIGGAAGSTTGAIKLIRLVTIFKGIYWEIMRIITPEGSVIPRKISGKSVSDVEIREASAYTSIYFIFLFISWLLLSSYGYDTLNALFEVVSAQGNVGLSMGITTAEMPNIPKIFLIFNMWLGRLEIIPVMVLFRTFLEVFKRN